MNSKFICVTIFLLLGFAAANNGGPPSKNKDETCVDSENRYSQYDVSFGSVVVQCPLEKVWPGMANLEQWYRNVLGGFMINITTTGKLSEIGSTYNYHVSPTSPSSTGGNTQQRLVSLDGFNFEFVTTFDFSTLALGPDCVPPCTGYGNPDNHPGSFSTRVRAHKVTFFDPACYDKDAHFSSCTTADSVDWTLIDFGQWGDINVPEHIKPLVRTQVQGFFFSVFGPRLKQAFDGCETRPEFEGVCVPAEVVSFSLVDDCDHFIRDLSDGDTIESGEGNIRANVADESFTNKKTKSVHFFATDGTQSRVDSNKPFTLLDGEEWAPAAGTYTITATPYSKNEQKGRAGIQKSITLNVVDA